MPVIKDGQAKLTYDQLGSPWRSGCPASSSFTWTAGEDAVAGRFHDAGGQSITWYGSACSGPLPATFSGIGLHGEAAAVLHAIDPLYYGVLPHSLHVTSSRSVRVAGTKAWRITFVVHYLRRGLPWSGEQGAIVITSSGAGSLYYVSVPSNFSPWIYHALVASLR
jgi:hypothetical protein